MLCLGSRDRNRLKNVPREAGARGLRQKFMCLKAKLLQLISRGPGAPLIECDQQRHLVDSGRSSEEERFS